MVNIILCGKSSDTSFSDALLPALERYGGVQYFSGKRLVRLGGDSPKFFLYDSEQVPQIEIPNGILLFKNSYHASESVNIPPDFSCVLETKNLNAAAVLTGQNITVITCGTSAKDTISIAGLDETNATLSLQRSIITVDGRILEPHDFTVRLHSKFGPHRILAVCASLLLSGIDSSLEYVI
jgi:hypothetical protein